MKKIFYLTMLVFVSVGLLGSCESDDFAQSVQSDGVNKGFQMSEMEAARIVSEFSKKVTRSSELQDVSSVDYILRESTRSKDKNDTLAYVFNYEKGGFSIVASDKRVREPVLAFSDKHAFSKDVSPSMEMFVHRIEGYVDEEIAGFDPGEPLPAVSKIQFIPPCDSICWRQSRPFNIKVWPSENDRRKVVGCVPLACASALVNAKNTIVVNRVAYNLKFIREALIKHDNPSSVNVQSIPTLDYTYEQAANAVGQILKVFYDQMIVRYDTVNNVAEAYFSNSANGCMKNILGDEYVYKYYNIDESINYLRNNYVIVMNGYLPGGGHAWVVDGCYYTYYIDNPSKINSSYIHCDWGWWGTSNGYYSSKVLASGNSGMYKPFDYFIIKKD